MSNYQAVEVSLTDISTFEVEGICVAFGGKQRHTSVTGATHKIGRDVQAILGKNSQEEGPLVLSRVPVKLTHCTRLHSHLRNCNRLGDSKGARVGDLD